MIVFHNGTLLTQDPANPRAEALVVSGERIAVVGAWKDVENLAGERIDLGGGTLVPGFNDAHVHVWKVGQLVTHILDLRSVESLVSLKETLRERDRSLVEGAWLLGRGYNEARLVEGRQPTRRDIDEAVSRRPVALTRTCGHMMVANSRALQLAGITRESSDPAGGAIVRDDHGEPTGLLQETAMGLLKAVMPEPSPAEYAEMVLAANALQLEKGITSATEAGALPNLLLAYRALDGDGKLTLRHNVMAMRLSDGDERALPLPERLVSDRLRIDSVKLFADGGLSGATAALTRSYRHAPTRGLLRLDEDALHELARESELAGLRVCTHAIGDAAIDLALTVYERLHSRGHRLEHFGLPQPAHLERAARIGVKVVPQAIFIESLGANFRRYLTEDYLEHLYPIRSMLNAGLPVALSSDAPVVTDFDPLLGIEAAVRRLGREGTPIAPGEAISVEEALFAYTMGGALASGDEASRGSLSEGKLADMVLLDRNPLEVPSEALHEVRVLKTFVSGRLVHEA